MATANEELLDALVRHQIALMRFAGAVNSNTTAILDATEADIAETIRRRLGRSRGLNTPADVRRLNNVLLSIRTDRAAAWGQARGIWLTEMHALAQSEPALVSGILKTVAPTDLETMLPSRQQLREIVSTRPIEGKTVAQWGRSSQAADIDRISGQVRAGMVQDEPAPQIARRVVGTKRVNGRNGITQTTRRQMATLAQTMVHAISHASREAFFQENTNITAREYYVATLDGSTTPICRSLDGKQYDVGRGPIPPLHFNCRSIRAPVLLRDAFGNRPSKPTTERLLLREYADENSLRRVASRADLPYGTKTQFDRFRGQRLRELVGGVPPRTTYAEWIGRQSAGFQDEVLGQARGRLFRRGELTLDRFVNRSGKQIPLSELARFNKNAFIKAGLDPEDFL